ncbi:MAG: 2-amino-4-hydroxy-6-hydroxymethyldihydropteridine diphosphokinase [Prevotella sp.]|nr:2-amino-4-hydroxy-6-hydroxymethyldihydropteridine diphosphokinase [Bacteroides sp.]MCM1366639.1 2-amino-4-hydroxy-6-hydroxymethyldihydropteridine diphosphokinase [Prevotella sp.]MCM1437004.1 2-amino-4-hydroxy-6-hydroxymethyldihydropteridine diphosphokinase [Prevotella sp.]
MSRDGDIILISLGSNCGQRENSICSAIEWLKNRLGNIICSEIYESESISKDGKMYLNCVVQAFLTGDIGEFEADSKEYELQSGRDKRARENGDVPIDIDIVVHGNNVLRPKDYTQQFFIRGLRMIEDKLKS